MSKFDDPEILRGVLENLPTGVYLVDRDGKILFWNSGAERITGHLRQEVVGHACREDFLGNPGGGDGEVSETTQALVAVLRDGKPTEALVSFRHKAGHLVPVRLRAVAMRDAHGAIIGVAECFDETFDVADSDRRHDKLAEYGCLDAASGTLTHGVLQSRLRETLVSFAEYAVPFCVVCIAFDHLDDVKARYGVAAIAAVLRAAGQTLQNSLRPTDFLGRWQENEFVAIVMECNGTEIPGFGERLKKMVSGAKITWWGDVLPVTIAMGATVVKTGDSVEAMVKRAEGALRESVSQGGNRMIVCND